MLRFSMYSTLLLSVVTFAVAQQTFANLTASTCSFQDGRQLSVRYSGQATAKDELHEGKVWIRGGTPAFLFTGSALMIGSAEIPAGAYSLYLIPSKDSWTLILNKNVGDASQYDEHQDILRVPMQIGEISNPDKHFKWVFAHIAPTQCNMRIYYGKTGTWAEFKEK